METVKKLLATLALAALAASITLAQPTTFLGPTAHLGVVKSMNDESAVALAGEAGPKNLRASGTIGWEYSYHQRIKSTAEYLRQRLAYSFTTGQQNAWVGQGAVGLDYQYDFRRINAFNILLDLSGYYAHSASKGLGVVTSVSTTPTSRTTTSVFNRIAGANAFGVAPALNIVTLIGLTTGLELNYDNVHYDTKYRSGLNVKGVGGTLRLNQALTEDVKVGGSAAIRQPFNNYAANITYGNLEYYGLWSLSAFGDYTVGKHTLPSSYNVGLGVDYFIDACNEKPLPQRPVPPPYKNYKEMPPPYMAYKDYKDMPPLVWVDDNKDFLNWVGVPAVRLPTVYAVPDYKTQVTSTCTLPPPTFSGIIANDDLIGPPPWTYDVSANFSGSNLTFSLNVSSISADTTVSISNSGVITINNTGIGPTSVTLSVTATNACGSVTSNTFNITD